MPDTDSVTIVKTFDYRGVAEEWSNSYHLDGTTPTNDAGWKTLCDAIWASERKIFHENVKIARYYGYEAGNDHSVYQLNFVEAGLSQGAGELVYPTSDRKMAGDQAATLRAYVRQSSTGKKVYVRKYYHGGTCPASSPDAVGTQMKTNMVAHATLMLGGTLPGSMKWVAPQGQVPSNPQASPWVTTRTLKRRGKRP